MITDRKIRCSILLCQLIAILSAVALFHLGFILVKPALIELNGEFYNDPIMCTTTETKIVSGKHKENKDDLCKDFTCKEWCISSPSPPCLQVMAMPRLKGATLELQCELSHFDETCSALVVQKAAIRNCKKPGECYSLEGLYNCTTGNSTNNPCRRMSPAYECSSYASLKGKFSCDYYNKCQPRLENGVYHCTGGLCRRFTDYKTFSDCQRRCDNMNLDKKNVLMVSKDRLIQATCSKVNSSSETINELENNNNWTNLSNILIVFCSFIEIKTENGFTKIYSKDCFNGTLEEAKKVQKITSFPKLIELMERVEENSTTWLLEAEEKLRLPGRKDTLLKINGGACVNTLRNDCQAFLNRHSVDGKDGRTRDRYECYYSNNTTDYVLRFFDIDDTWNRILLGSLLPAVLMVFSCLCLFICSKSIDVDNYGHFKVPLLQGGKSADD